MKRYIECGDRCSLNNVINGVMRTQALKASTLNWDYIGSDRQLTQELTLYGKFVEIPEVLFYRRVQDGARFGAGTRETYREYYPDDEFDSKQGPRLRLAQGVRGVNLAPLGDGQAPPLPAPGSASLVAPSCTARPEARERSD